MVLDQNKILDNLKIEKVHLESKLCAIEGDLKRGLNRKRHEQAVQLENHEVLLEILRVTESELNEVNKKIYHLENSNY